MHLRPRAEDEVDLLWYPSQPLVEVEVGVVVEVVVAEAEELRELCSRLERLWSNSPSEARL
jgi:hypothetical protein